MPSLLPKSFVLLVILAACQEVCNDFLFAGFSGNAEFCAGQVELSTLEGYAVSRDNSNLAMM